MLELFRASARMEWTSDFPFSLFLFSSHSSYSIISPQNQQFERNISHHLLNTYYLLLIMLGAPKSSLPILYKHFYIVISTLEMRKLGLEELNTWLKITQLSGVGVGISAGVCLFPNPYFSLQSHLSVYFVI